MRESAVPDELLRSFREDHPYVRPQVAMFNIVRRCNAGCHYCVDWKNNPDPRTDPDAALIRQVLDGLRALGVPRVVFSGGEPFLRRDLYEIIAYAKRRGFELGLITNGTAATEARIVPICDLEPVFFAVSIDSLDELRMRSIRGLPVRRVLDTIDVLMRTRNERRSSMNITLQVTISRTTIDDLVPLARFAADNDLSVSYQPVHFAGSGTPDSVLNNLWPDESDIGRLIDVVERLVAMKRAGCRIKNREAFLRQIPLFFRNRTFYPDDGCTVAYTDIVIDTEFGVRPCWSMDPVAYLGPQVRIEDVWTSDAMRDARRAIRQRQCPGCLYKCHLNKPHLNIPEVDPARRSALQQLDA